MCFQRGQLFLSWSVIALFSSSQLMDVNASTVNIQTFSDSYGTIKFNHLVVDKVGGWVFIGAVNRLYQLSPEMEVENNISTIPIVHRETKITENYNKILVLDYENYQLISCGSLFQGLCQIYKIQDSLRKVKLIGEPVTVSNPNASTVAFVAPGPFIRGKNVEKTSMLYVGVTYAKSNAMIPAVATRSLEESKSFQISFQSDLSFASSTQIFFNNAYQEKYIVNYVYGFSSGSHSYFLTTQMESAQPSQYISKLVRLCQKDEHYNSYTEIPIKCTDRNEKIYNLIQAAFIAKPNAELAKSLSITPQDDVLFGVFARSKESYGNESNQSDNESALCVYSLEEIHNKFTENIQNCFNGIGERGLEHILPKQKCIKKNPINDTNSCGITLNTPFGGKIPVQATAAITFDTLLTAVTAVSKSDFTLVITGTITGHLMPIAVKNTTSAVELNDLVINERSPVNSDLQFDPKMDFLYAMTERELKKIQIQDLLPSISYVSPDKGPWEGGTNVTIGIVNFGDLLEGNHLEIKIAGISCTPYEHEYKPLEKIVCITDNGSSSLKFHEGPIEIFVDEMRVAGEKKFTFVDPKIYNVSLKKLSSDRTEIMIEGDHLNAGNSVSVFIGNISCPVFFNDLHIIQCSTNLSAAILNGNVTVKIDQSIRLVDKLFSDVIDSKQGFSSYVSTSSSQFSMLFGNLKLLVFLLCINCALEYLLT